MKFTHHVFLLGVAFLLFIPAILFGPSGVDLPTQSLWVHNFTDQLYAGELYPRWMMNMTAGYGNPVFFFYPPLAYYFTAPFAFLASYGDFHYLQITASACMAVYLSGYAFYRWMRSEGLSGNAGLAGALLYMSAPIGICSNFYHLMLFSSLWAYVWIPLVLMFARQMVKNLPYAIAAYALTLGCLIMTNIPSTMITCIMVAVIFLMGIRGSNIVRLLAYFATGTALAAGLAAIYLMPASYLQGDVNINLEWVRFVHWARYENHTVSILLWVYYSALAVLLFLYQRKNTQREKTPIALGMAGLLLLLPLSDWIWVHIPLFIYIQMSDRLFLIPVIALAWLAALSAPQLRRVSYGVAAVSLVAAFAVSYANHFSEADYGRDQPIKEEMYKLDIDTYAMFLPGMGALKYFGSPVNIKALGEDNPQVSFLSGDAKIKVLEWGPQKIVLTYQATVPSIIMIRRFLFPGFIAYGAGNELAILHDDPAGRMKLALPAGFHQIILERWELVAETLGEEITFFTLCILALPVLLRLRHNARRRKKAAKGIIFTPVNS